MKIINGLKDFKERVEHSNNRSLGLLIGCVIGIVVGLVLVTTQRGQLNINGIPITVPFQIVGVLLITGTIGATSSYMGACIDMVTGERTIIDFFRYLYKKIIECCAKFTKSYKNEFELPHPASPERENKHRHFPFITSSRFPNKMRSFSLSDSQINIDLDKKEYIKHLELDQQYLLQEIKKLRKENAILHQRVMDPLASSFIKRKNPKHKKDFNTYSQTEISMFKHNNTCHRNKWYTDDIINTLFDYLSQKYYPAIYTLSAMLSTDWNGVEGKENTLQANITDFNQQRLEAIRQNQAFPDILLIPVNLGNYHWVLLKIHYLKNATKDPVISYFDPLGSPLPDEVNRALKASFSIPKLVISSELKGPVQTDNYNCGPWVVLGAEVLAKQESMLDISKNDIHIVRSEQQKLFHELSSVTRFVSAR